MNRPIGARVARPRDLPPLPELRAGRPRSSRAGSWSQRAPILAWGLSAENRVEFPLPVRLRSGQVSHMNGRALAIFRDQDGPGDARDLIELFASFPPSRRSRVNVGAGLPVKTWGLPPVRSSNRGSASGAFSGGVKLNRSAGKSVLKLQFLKRRAGILPPGPALEVPTSREFAGELRRTGCHGSTAARMAAATVSPTTLGMHGARTASQFRPLARQTFCFSLHRVLAK